MISSRTSHPPVTISHPSVTHPSLPHHRSLYTTHLSLTTGHCIPPISLTTGHCIPPISPSPQVTLYHPSLPHPSHSIPPISPSPQVTVYHPSLTHQRSLYTTHLSLTTGHCIPPISPSPQVTVYHLSLPHHTHQSPFTTSRHPPVTMRFPPVTHESPTSNPPVTHQLLLLPEFLFCICFCLVVYYILQSVSSRMLNQGLWLVLAP